MEVIVDGISLLDNVQNYDDTCGYYGEDWDGSCAVDLDDGCECDTYSGAGFAQE